MCSRKDCDGRAVVAGPSPLASSYFGDLRRSDFAMALGVKLFDQIGVSAAPRVHRRLGGPVTLSTVGECLDGLRPTVLGCSVSRCSR